MSDRTIPKQSVHDVATFKLISNGKDVTYDYGVLSLSVNRAVNKIPAATLVLDDGSAVEETFEASEGDDFAPGKMLEIALGYDGNDQSVFKGLIVKQTIKADNANGSRLILDCRSITTRLTVGRHSRYFVNKSDSDTIEEIVGGYQRLTADINEGPQTIHSEIVQYYATDWDFVLSRADMNGQIVLADDSQIKIKPPTVKGPPLITLTYGANLLQLEAEMDTRFQHKAVTAETWSPTDQTLINADAVEPPVPPQGNQSGQELADALGLETLTLRHGGNMMESELQTWADAQLLKSRLAKMKGLVKTLGYADAKPDALIRLSGTGQRFNGLAYVSGIRHELTQGIWSTYLQLGLSPQWFYQTADNIVEQSASGLLPGVHGLQVGVVVQLHDDPKGEDRILVRVPAIDSQVEGAWVRVATLDAGDQRGTFFRPDVGDEVILGFVNGDPRHPIMLGMLHSSAKPAPLRALKENPQKGFVTRSQHRLIFDDDKKIITVTTPGGKQLVLSDEKEEIQLKDKNGNQLTLNQQGITLKSAGDIVLEATGKIAVKATGDASYQGMNIDLKAQGQFKAQGNAGAEVSTGAIAVLKGSLVQIN